jgi:cobalt-zinc-cadmium resistance protein CzcA
VVLTETDVRDATTEVIRPIFFATLIIIVAYLPLFAFERAEGKLLSPMAFTVAYALIGALLCSIVLVPGLAYMALHKPRRIFHNQPLEWLSAGYRKTLGRLLNNPAVSYGIGAASLAGVIVLGAATGREFMPNLDEGTLWLQVQMPSGLSLDKGSEMASELRRTLLEFPEVSYAVTQR